VNHTLREEFPAKIIIAEICPETPDAINGAGFDSIWFHFPHYDAIKLVEKATGAGIVEKDTVRRLPSRGRGCTLLP
jgi:hypothetical protein